MPGKLILWGTERSPPVRAVLFTLKMLDLDFEFKIINYSEGENLTEEYLQKNPQHTVPTLEDDGKYIWDSHAIMCYLVNKYAKDDSLYPKDPYTRAVIDQRLHFDTGVLFEACLKQVLMPIYKSDKPEFSAEKLEIIWNAYSFMEAFLGNNSHFAGDHLTLADLSILCTVATFILAVSVDANKYPKLSSWLENMKSIPHYDEYIGEQHRRFAALMKDKFGK